jgi:3-isopropylmalate dehydrogenase
VHQGLLWLGSRKSDPKLDAAAEAIERAVMSILERGRPLTYDLVDAPAKAARCSEVGTAIAEEARKLAGRT